MLTSSAKANAAAKTLSQKIKGSILGNAPIGPDPLKDKDFKENTTDLLLDEKDLMVALSEYPIYGVPS